mmetsp:Transcript_4271/g.9713  ORF Transcript_4271/g.9713 Transcript_4271/m.9713 type:complete len:114 (-) Transcript_4271:781-1122(-)
MIAKLVLLASLLTATCKIGWADGGASRTGGAAYVAPMARGGMPVAEAEAHCEDDTLGWGDVWCQPGHRIAVPPPPIIIPPPGSEERYLIPLVPSPSNALILATIAQAGCSRGH